MSAVDPKVSKRAQIEPFHVMEVMRAAADRVAAGADVVHLEVGQPGTPAPAGVLAAAHEALDSETLGYTVALGDPELRRRIAGHYLDSYSVHVDPANVVVTSGSSGAFVLVFIAAFEAGDRVAVPSPGYPAYRNMLAALDIEVVDLDVGADDDFILTPEHLAEAGPLDGVIVASPNNPTGTMLTRNQLEAVATWCDEHDVVFISDEIYHGVTFSAAATSAIDLPGEPVVVNSFSKYFSMTGWRLGWVVVPDHLLTPIERLAQNLTIAPSTIAQIAARAAFDCETELQANVDRYSRHRDLLLQGLTAMGFTDLAPADGAFYVWADVSHLTHDSQHLCARWLDELGVAATPGLDFDTRNGARHVRFSYAGTTDDITQAIERLSAWIEANPAGEYVQP